MDAIATRILFRIVANGKIIAAADTINEIADSVRYLRPDVYQIEEVVNIERRFARRMPRFWGRITHHDGGMVSVEPCPNDADE